MPYNYKWYMVQKSSKFCAWPKAVYRSQILYDTHAIAHMNGLAFYVNIPNTKDVWRNVYIERVVV